MTADKAPFVWVVSSHRVLNNEHGHPQHYTLVDEGGQQALLSLGLQPVCFPRVPADRLATMLDGVQGVMLGGSATNVHPRHYGQAPVRDGMAFDDERDALALPLVRLCIERGIPLIGFCRGSHEINVALGGSLQQDLRSSAGVVHWEAPDESLDRQYADRHEITLRKDGELSRITGCTRFPVNSLHSQGVERLGSGLVAEAFADDGLVEAFRWPDTRRFAWGFQFHPEWKHDPHPWYGKIMAAFAQACWSRWNGQPVQEAAAGATPPPARAPA
jgi:putative glutamine amidotransferase